MSNYQLTINNEGDRTGGLAGAYANRRFRT
jgi:hypothetical protein